MEQLAPARERVGEIVEASSAELVAQSVRLHHAPALGSFVVAPAAETFIYAVVCETHTGSLESGGRPIARGHAEVTDAAIYHANPDLEHVLRTEFRALIVGYERSGQTRQHLPPSPPSLHYSVYACAPIQVRAFTDRLDYLRALLQASAAPADELTAANVRLAAAAWASERDTFLLRAGRELAVLLRDDYERLTALLRRLNPEETRQ